MAFCCCILNLLFQSFLFILAVMFPLFSFCCCNISQTTIPFSPCVVFRFFFILTFRDLCFAAYLDSLSAWCLSLSTVLTVLLVRMLTYNASFPPAFVLKQSIKWTKGIIVKSTNFHLKDSLLCSLTYITFILFQHLQTHLISRFLLDISTFYICFY